MRVFPRIAAPILCALLCSGAFLAFLWWQLSQSSVLLTKEPHLPPPSSEAVALSPLSPSFAIDPRDEALVRLRRGDLFTLQGSWAEAEGEYWKSVAAGGGLPALRKLARAQLQRRDIRGVRATIDQLKHEGARSEDIVLLESIVHLRSGELVEARNLLEHSPPSPQRSYGLALLAIIEGNHEQVQAALREVAQGWEPILRSYAKTLQAAYDEYALFPESPNFHLITLLSRALAQVQECELALPLLLQVTQEREDYRDAWIVQGYCELTTERPTQALASLEHSYNLDPAKPETQYFLARAYAAIGDYRNAITFFQFALENGFEPQEEARSALATAAIDAGEVLIALEQYKLLASREGATIDDSERFVTAALTANEKDAAYDGAVTATHKWPDSARAFFLLGWTESERGSSDAAQAAFEKSLSLDPNLKSAQENLEQLTKRE